MFWLSKKKLFHEIKIIAFKHDYLSYVIASDLHKLKRTSDIFLDSEILIKCYEEFQSFSKDETYQPGGMINTQLFLLYSLIRHVKPVLFIESGTKNGYSTKFIAEALKRNDNNARMICLSLFTEDELKKAKERIYDYGFVKIMEGCSEVLIDNLKSEDVLIEKICHNFKELQFLSFDAGHEHMPYWNTAGNYYNRKRSVNIERAKIIDAYEKYFCQKGYSITIQSNQTALKYEELNNDIFRFRNENWGKSFPWKPYNVDRISGHIAHSYKLAIIYKNCIFPKKCSS